MSKRIQIRSSKAAPASGSYAQALKCGNLFFTTVVPYGMQCEIVGDTMAQQTKQTMENLRYLLEEAGIGFDNVVKVTAYLYESDTNFGEFAKVYESYFPEGDYPARSSHNASLFVHEGRQCMLEMEVMAVFD